MQLKLWNSGTSMLSDQPKEFFKNQYNDFGEKSFFWSAQDSSIGFIFIGFNIRNNGK